MGKLLRYIITILLLIIIVCSILYFINKDLFLKYTNEDGLIENLTAGVCFFFSVFLLIRYIKASKNRSTSWKIVNILMILGLFFVFGEEISWGQRIFDIESNEFFLENNKQQETNLHNLKVLGIGVNKLIFGKLLTLIFGFYFLFGYVLYKKVPSIKKIVNDLGIPIPKASQTAVLLGVTALIMTVPDSNKWELWELMLSVILLWAFIDPYNEDEKLFYMKKELKIKNRLKIYPPTTIKVP
ncbi:hypothetical protein [Marinigracilibium pacificum]|uniref:Uncharacterized protein n=1 Tax=Marinigracilibium pacificum TaxID=2729599 RepID=A0A848J1Y4_9BACT|nr:hypothetical protein [Marinigracilibium pacificum]NMM48550.1 hypothetical protein [Marinigracilibium pacificum]